MMLQFCFNIFSRLSITKKEKKNYRTTRATDDLVYTNMYVIYLFYSFNFFYLIFLRRKQFDSVFFVFYFEIIFKK